MDLTLARCADRIGSIPALNKLSSGLFYNCATKTDLQKKLFDAELLNVI